MRGCASTSLKIAERLGGVQSFRCAEKLVACRQMALAREYAEAAGCNPAGSGAGFRAVGGLKQELSQDRRGWR